MNRRLTATCVALWAFFSAACCFFGGDNPPKARNEEAAEKKPTETRLKTEPPGSPAPNQNPENVAVIDPAEMLRLYLDNPVAMDAKYKGSVVEFRGVIHSVGRNISDGPFAVFKASPPGFLVGAWFLKTLEPEVLKIKKGQKVSIRGRVEKSVVMKRDASVNFNMEDCTILEVTGEPEQPAPANRKADETPARKAAYVSIHSTLAKVEADALAKYGKTDTIPAKVFIERETLKALAALANELAIMQTDLDGIRREGDEKKWPKK